MTAPWNKLRAEALDSTHALVEVLSDGESDVSILITSYLDSKSALATAFAVLAKERYGQDSALDDAIKLVKTALTAFSDVPDRYRKMRNYSASHRILLAYLVRNVGIPVSAATLKMINGEQSETARRTRELRTLGFDIEAIRTGGQDSYTLKSAEPDTSLGALQQIAQQIREDKNLSQQERDQLLRNYGVDA
jgi:hypothetical protein